MGCLGGHCGTHCGTLEGGAPGGGDGRGTRGPWPMGCLGGRRGTLEGGAHSSSDSSSLFKVLPELMRAGNLAFDDGESNDCGG